MPYARIENGKAAEIKETAAEGWEHFSGSVAVGWLFLGGVFTPAPKEEKEIDLVCDEKYNSPEAQLARVKGKMFDALIKAVLTGDIIELQSLEDHAALLRPHLTE